MERVSRAPPRHLRIAGGRGPGTAAGSVSLIRKRGEQELVLKVQVLREPCALCLRPVPRRANLSQQDCR